MTIIHIHRKRAFSGIFLPGIFFILISFLQPDISAALQREQEAVPTAVLQQVPTIDAGFDFIQVGKPAQNVAPVLSNNIIPVRSSGSSQPRAATLYTPEQALRDRAFEEKKRQSARVTSYEIQQKPVEKELRPVVSREKKNPVVVPPAGVSALPANTREEYLAQSESQKERFLDALYLRAEAYYEKREYESCTQTLNSIFMFDPYHVKAQRLRRKAEIKAAGSRSPSAFTLFFGNREHRKKIGLVRKLYRKGDYEQAIELCQQVIVEDPENNKAEDYLNKCKRAMHAERRKAETSIKENDTIVEPIPDVASAEVSEPVRSAPLLEPTSVAADETLRQEQILKEKPAVAGETIIPKIVPEMRPDISEKTVSVPAVAVEEQGVFSKEEAQEIALQAMMDSMGQGDRQAESKPAVVAPEVSRNPEIVREASLKNQHAEPQPTVIPKVSLQPDVVREPTLEERADQAREALDLGDIAQAQGILDQMLMQDPENRLSQEVMNDISRWIQDNERSKLDKGSSDKKKKALVRKNEKLARKAYKEKKYDRARSLYEKVLSLDPKNRSAKRGLNKTAKKEKAGMIEQYVGTVKELHKQRRYTEASQTIKQGLAFAPADNDLQKLAKENARLLQKDISAAPETVTPAHVEKNKKGLLSVFQREKKPLTGNEAEVEQLLHKAKRAYKTGDYSEAVSLYEDVLALDHENKKAAREIDRAREKMILKGRDKQKEEEQRAEQEVNEKIEFYTSIAQKLHKQGKYESAKVVIQKGLLLDPDNQVLKQLRKDNEVFAKGMIEKAPTSEAQKLQKEKDTLINKGIKQYLLGDYEQAIKCFNEVLVLDPTDEKAKNSIAKIEQRSQKVAPLKN